MRPTRAIMSAIIGTIMSAIIKSTIRAIVRTTIGPTSSSADQPGDCEVFEVTHQVGPYVLRSGSKK